MPSAARWPSWTGIETHVIVPDSNRSATARSITTRSPLSVEEVRLDDGGIALRDRRHAGRLRPLRRPGPGRRAPGPDRLRDQPRLQPGRRHHLFGHGGGGLGGHRAGIPAIAISQQSTAREMSFLPGRSFDFAVAARFGAQLVALLGAEPLPAGDAPERQLPGR